MILPFTIITLLLFYYVYFLVKILVGLSRIKNTGSLNSKLLSVTVIIPFRNESDNILAVYNSLVNQNYPEELIEFIFVNDNSSDDSVNKIIPYLNSRVKLLHHISKINQSPKKAAIELGIQSAKGEIIVLTDADCKHARTWIRSLVSLYDNNTALVAGPVVFLSSAKIFDKIQGLEFAGIILAAAGLIGFGQPATCSSANLSFRKSVFYEVGGYSGLKHLSSGDDELLMQKIHSDTEYQIKFSFTKSSLVETNSSSCLSEFFHQRKRWASKGLFYKNKTFVGELILIFLFYLSLPVQLMIGLFINPVYLISLFVCLAVKLVFEIKIMKNGIGILLNKEMLHYIYIAEPFQIFYIITASVLGSLGSFNWKGRKFKR